MKKFYAFIFVFFISPFAFADSLFFSVQEVLDLATYEDVYQNSIPLTEANDQSFEFDINDWPFSAPNFTIKVMGLVKPIESHTYYVKFKKVLLFKNELKAVLIEDNFLLHPKLKTYLTDDFYRAETTTGKEVFIRQENLFELQMSSY